MPIVPPKPRFERGFGWMVAQHIEQADPWFYRQYEPRRNVGADNTPPDEHRRIGGMDGFVSLGSSCVITWTRTCYIFAYFIIM